MTHTRFAQRKRTISHSTMENIRNIIDCCNNTHQVAPHTGKQMYAGTSDLDDAIHVTYAYNGFLQLYHSYLVLDC